MGNVLRILPGDINGSNKTPLIETTRGVINPKFAPYINRLIPYCQKYGVRLQVVVWSGGVVTPDSLMPPPTDADTGCRLSHKNWDV